MFSNPKGTLKTSQQSYRLLVTFLLSENKESMSPSGDPPPTRHHSQQQTLTLYFKEIT